MSFIKKFCKEEKSSVPTKMEFILLIREKFQLRYENLIYDIEFFIFSFSSKFIVTK